ncbi:MAG: transposase [Eubacteriaceae bacterium]|nr:transposase [Eubacteriaceae bacterium]
MGLSPQELVGLYGHRWKIEALFRGAKTKLGLDSHMLRSSKAIKMFWIVTCLVHNLCTGFGIAGCPF